jgi:predicted transcriptional regulator
MGDIKSIEKAVESLPPSELAEFRRWFAEFDAAAWQVQDVEAGLAEADRGEFATPEEVTSFFAKHGC